MRHGLAQTVRFIQVHDINVDVALVGPTLVFDVEARTPGVPVPII